MTTRLELRPIHRPGWRQGAASAAERWSWDFVVDGQSLFEAVQGDLTGALGWGERSWQAQHVAKLLGQAPPDLPPDRVMLYICPECADLSCGAITASVRQAEQTITWADLRWERDWESPDADEARPLGPFVFDRHAYERALTAAASTPAGPSAAPIRAV